EGSSPADQSFNVLNSGGGTLNYSISASETWLSCTPSSGTSTGGQDTITVSYSTSSLSAGTYPAMITVSDPAADNTPQTISVSLTVASVSNKDEMEASSPCFIATAAFGSPMDYHVKILREFRDKRLLTSGIGRGLVSVYYKISPSVAELIRKNQTARAAVRCVLIPITGAAFLALYFHPIKFLIGLTFILLGSILCYRCFHKSRAKSYVLATSGANPDNLSRLLNNI
ncbi:MAG: BACON domain-containing protein, partial [Candidatus Omnitrophota bacterium]